MSKTLNFLIKFKEPRTNWKYILAVVILTFLVGGGILGYSKHITREINSISQFPEIKRSIKVVENETANWRTYKNEEYGFKINYPESWEHEVKYGKHNGEMRPSRVIFKPLEEKDKFFYLTITVYKNPNRLSSKQWVEKIFRETEEEDSPLPRYKETKEFTIAGHQAYELYGVFTFDLGSYEDIYLSKDSYTYSFAFPVGPEENNKIVHQMLSTFRFLE